MHKKIATVPIMGILLVGILAAGIIPYLGRITGTTIVSAPTFFPRQISFGTSNQTYYKMGDYNFTSNDINKTVSFTGGDSVWFVSYPLNLTQLAKANYSMSVEARSDNESGQLNALLLIIGNETDNYNVIEPLCSASAGKVFNRSIYNLSCTGNQISNMDPTWRLGLELSNGSDSVDYHVYLNGNTKTEMVVK